MKHIYPLPIHHSWPLYERERQFALGQLLDYDSLDADVAAGGTSPGARTLGQWSCDLADNTIDWSSEVYRIFGFPNGARVSREETVALYAEPSRAAMEKLRAYAIRHRRGFTLDAEIRPATGKTRWMRLIAAPLCSGDVVVKLQGLKFLLAQA